MLSIATVVKLVLLLVLRCCFYRCYPSSPDHAAAVRCGFGFLTFFGVFVSVFLVVRGLLRLDEFLNPSLLLVVEGGITSLGCVIQGL